jgi:hypothetical protein
VRPYVVVTTMRPPTKIAEESTVPSSLTCLRCRLPTLPVLSRASGETLRRPLS